jgi:hypothetical protein
VPIEQHVQGGKIIVQQMFMIDLVKSPIFDYPFHVQKLNNKHSVAAQSFAYTVSHGMQFFKMKEDTSGINDVELLRQSTG